MVAKTSEIRTWKLAEAKNKLSEVVTRAIDEGPQEITRRDDTVVLISRTEYDRLRDLEPKKPDFKEFLLNWAREDGPEHGLEIPRLPLEPRDVEW